MLLKTSEVLNMAQAFAAMSGRSVPIKLSYAISVNSRRIAPITQAAEDQRKALLIKVADKDENGKPVTANNQYVFADPESFAAPWREIMDELVEVDLHMVDFASLPETIEPGMFDAFAVMVREIAQGLVIPVPARKGRTPK